MERRYSAHRQKIYAGWHRPADRRLGATALKSKPNYGDGSVAAVSE